MPDNTSAQVKPGSHVRRRANEAAGIDFFVLDDVAIRLGSKVVLRHTNWTWRRGEQWALLGPNGSGKSLLVQMLLGRIPLAHGEVRGPLSAADSPEVTPEDAVALVSPQTQRELVLQESSFYQSRWHSGSAAGQRTVDQFLSQASVEAINPFEVDPPRGNRREFLRRRRQFVRWLGLKPLLGRRLVHLSNGELRKTLLVHSLLRAPRLLILDDPYAGLDAASREHLRRVIQRLMRAGWPVLLVTHRRNEIPDPTTHLLRVENHRIVALGAKSAVLQGVGEPVQTVSRRHHRFTQWPQTKPKSARPTRSPAPLVELRNVTISAGRKRILRGVNWTLRPGECWALLGPNGAGKTTLLNLIQGDHPQAYAQDLRLFGAAPDNTQARWEAREQIGWCSPELHLHHPPDWPLLDVVCSGFFNSLGLHQLCTRRQRAAARQWLADFGLATNARQLFGDLSAAQQRMALLARAVVKQPKLLILDEPCQGLDTFHRQAILAAIDRVVEQTGASLILVTHRTDEMPRCVTHVLRLKAGRVQAQEAPQPKR